MKRAVKRSIAPILCLAACLVLAACPNDTKNAANGVHAYLVSLKSFQDAEVQLHNDGKVPDALHFNIQDKVKIANGVARHLDAAVLAKTQGKDVTAYIDEAKGTFQDILTATALDANTKQGLSLVAQAADDALKNAIMLIEAVKVQQAAPKPSPTQSTRQIPWLLWAFALPMFAAGGGMVVGDPRAQAIFDIVRIALQLEPIAAQALSEFLKTKGQDTAAILALNQTLEDEIDATADAELAKKPQA